MKSIARLLTLEFPFLSLSRKDEKKSEWPEDLIRICKEKKEISRIGKEYLLKVPLENDSSFLEELISCSSANPMSIKERIKQDFAAGNTVIIRGWILSITEARQCALLSLTE